MNLILVIYPPEFTCYTKFQRKLNNITSTLPNYQIISPNDPNGMAEKFSQESPKEVNLSIDSDWINKPYTHAVIFDDGEEFQNEVEHVKSNRIPLRVIKIDITRVINIKMSDEYSASSKDSKFEYIGRGSYWGNPYSIYDVEDLEDETPRDNVIRKFKYDFDHDCLLNRDKNNVYALSGKRLGCYCKPEACHGDVIADFLNSWDDGK